MANKKLFKITIFTILAFFIPLASWPLKQPIERPAEMFGIKVMNEIKKGDFESLLKDFYAYESRQLEKQKYEDFWRYALQEQLGLFGSFSRIEEVTEPTSALTKEWEGPQISITKEHPEAVILYYKASFYKFGIAYIAMAVVKKSNGEYLIAKLMIGLPQNNYRTKGVLDNINKKFPPSSGRNKESFFPSIVVLKTGKTLKGKIVEETDKYLKLNIDGVPLTYYIGDVESIDGRKPVSPFTEYTDFLKKGAEQAQKQPIEEQPFVITMEINAKEWQNWYENVKDYLNTVEKLLAENSTYQAKGDLLAKQAKQSEGDSATKEELAKTKDQVRLLLDRLNTLTPPKDLAEYHTNAKEAIEYNAAMFAAALENNSVEVSQCMLMATKATRNSLAILKNIFSQKKAPQEKRETIDNAIIILNGIIKSLGETEENVL